MFAPHVLQPLGGVQDHVIKPLGTGTESGKVGKHQFASEPASVPAAPALPEAATGRLSGFLRLTVIGVGPPDGKAGNVWL
ncbi:hypothetical protein GCM10010523_18990 [Paenarthrobacter ilicis]